MEIVSKKRHFKNLEPLFPDGIPQSSIIAVAGVPGAGKTIFSSQLMFELEDGLNPIWFSTFSEPQNILISHLSDFNFFNKGKIGNPVQYIDLASVFSAENSFEKVMEIIESETKKYKANIVFIDSFRQILEWANFSNKGFQLIQNFPQYFAMRGITTFLLGEYDEQAIRSEVDFFGMVDGIIRITNDQEGSSRNRYIEVLKMRGTHFYSGLHPVKIDNNGFHIFTNKEPISIKESSTQRIGTGVEEINHMLEGGILKNSFVMLAGASGTGKTTFGSHFLGEGIKNNERVLFYSTEEERPQILRNAASLGLDFVAAENQGLLLIESPTNDSASLEEFLFRIKKLIEENKISRLFLDSLTSIARYQSDEKVHHFTKSLRAFAKQNGVTVFVSSETTDVTSTSGQEKGINVSSLTDVVISLRYVEVNAEMIRAIMVLKSRGGDHDKSLRQYTITNQGFIVGQPLSGMEGILTGNTRKIGASTSERIYEILLDVFGPLASNINNDLKALAFEADAVNNYFNQLVSQGILSDEQKKKINQQINTIINS